MNIFQTYIEPIWTKYEPKSTNNIFCTSPQIQVTTQPCESHRYFTRSKRSELRAKDVQEVHRFMHSGNVIGTEIRTTCQGKPTFPSEMVMEWKIGEKKNGKREKGLFEITRWRMMTKLGTESSCRCNLLFKESSRSSASCRSGYLSIALVAEKFTVDKLRTGAWLDENQRSSNCTHENLWLWDCALVDAGEFGCNPKASESNPVL